MDEEIFENAPFIAWIHNLSKSQLKYLNSRLNDLDLGHEIKYIMMIYENPNSSQDDLVNFSCQSKGNIAKIVKKLEDMGYVERSVNPNNRRKYMLKTTSKANDIVPKIRKVSKEWEIEVGLTPDDDELKQRIKEISINSMKLVGE